MILELFLGGSVLAAAGGAWPAYRFMEKLYGKRTCLEASKAPKTFTELHLDEMESIERDRERLWDHGCSAFWLHPSFDKVLKGVMSLDEMYELPPEPKIEKPTQKPQITEKKIEKHAGYIGSRAGTGCGGTGSVGYTGSRGDVINIHIYENCSSSNTYWSYGGVDSHKNIQQRKQRRRKRRRSARRKEARLDAEYQIAREIEREWLEAENKQRKIDHIEKQRSLAAYHQKNMRKKFPGVLPCGCIAKEGDILGKILIKGDFRIVCCKCWLSWIPASRNLTERAYDDLHRRMITIRANEINNAFFIKKHDRWRTMT